MLMIADWHSGPRLSNYAGSQAIARQELQDKVVNQKQHAIDMINKALEV